MRIWVQKPNEKPLTEIYRRHISVTPFKELLACLLNTQPAFICSQTLTSSFDRDKWVKIRDGKHIQPFAKFQLQTLILLNLRLPQLCSPDDWRSPMISLSENTSSALPQIFKENALLWIVKEKCETYKKKFSASSVISPCFTSKIRGRV